jgi:dipeptidyl-peptidase 4
VSTDGARVWFLRSPGPEDPVHSLWVFDLAAGVEQLVLDPRALGADDTALPPAERARRERARESGEGVVSYATDRAGERAVVAVGGQVVLARSSGGDPVVLDAAPGAFDPRLDPAGERVAYVAGDGLRVVSLTEPDHQLVAEDGVGWGAAEFVAAEEFSRTRGFWWSPDGTAILAERVDESEVAEWHIASPAEPWSAPRPIRYPAAGTANARCSLAVLGLDGGRIDLDWDGESFPYLLTVDWGADSPLTISVLSRDQRTMSIQTVDPATGRCTEVRRHEDTCWVEPVEGVPAWSGGRLVTVADDESARRVMVDGQPLSPPDLQVRTVVDAGDSGVLVSCSFDDPTEVHLARIGWDGAIERLTSDPGVHAGTASGPTLVVSAAGMDHDGAVVSVVGGGATLAEAPRLRTVAEAPDLDLSVRFLELGEGRLRAALVMPAAGGDGPLPVLLDPYGGPHAQRVVKARGAFSSSQWFADQGFAVLVVDGRGTPGRGPAWERAVQGDLAGPVLQDQVDALHAAAEIESRLDLGRVGIRGWSFGGYLAALAVLARPDVFHVAVAGAPVTDWRLYDTGYTERYLGFPDAEPDNYERTDLTPLAPGLRRPLMLIHGLADDNVVVAHTLQLSRALLEAGRPHTVLPLSGVTHMTPQEAVAENLLLLQVAFLKHALRMEDVEDQAE